MRKKKDPLGQFRKHLKEAPMKELFMGLSLAGYTAKLMLPKEHSEEEMLDAIEIASSMIADEIVSRMSKP